MSDIITSASNPIAKRIRALAERKHRKRENAFVVEGMQPVWRAAESGWGLDTLVIAPDLVTNAQVDQMANRLRDAGTRVVYIGADLFSRLSDRDGPSGVMAIVETSTRDLSNLAVSADAVFVVLHRVHNPGNLGTIIRTADAAGVAGVILVGDCTDPFSPAAVKASMGSIFAVPIVQELEADSVFAWAEKHGVPLVGTSGYASDAHWDIEWNPPIAILLGNEGDGLPQEILEKANCNVRIPMSGTAESLNLSVAAALLMYEARRHVIG